MNHNIILMTDSYKHSHYKCYPPKTKCIFSYFESREGAKFPSTLFFGLQYYLMKYLSQPVIYEHVEEAKKLLSHHLMTDNVFNEEGWRHIIEKHNGRLPVLIKAIPEGTLVPESNVLLTIENTDPKCFWITNHLETLLSKLWYPCTVATQSYYLKKLINKYLIQTGTPEDIDFKLHDFGYRGVTSEEQAGIGGLAHLVSFKGTDTVEALRYADKYYGERCAGFSIPATEHSTITSWTKNQELAAYRNVLDQYPSGIVACVSDSYDIYNACENLWGKELKEQVLNRNGCLVIRPDSGNPVEVLPKILRSLAQKFGSSFNKKGYEVLNPKVRIIQGDGVDYDSIKQILDCLKSLRWSADNISFGSGGGLLQKINRDTQKFAFKCSYAVVDRFGVDVFKQPVTDDSKKSKSGYLGLFHNTVRGTYTDTIDYHNENSNLLKLVYLNGEILKINSLNEIRNKCLSN